jgi:glucan phosphorylase
MEMVAKLLSWSGIQIDMKDVGCVNLANHVFQQLGTATGPDTLNMTYLALNLSHYVNGVAKKHAEVSRHMFAEY